MLWQLLIVGLIVVAASAYLGWRAWRTWGRKASGCGGCGSGCKGESPDAAARSERLIPADQLTVRRRSSPPGH
ncbi:MAG TPA: FeoB-associated Cys-rich membrane protein [Gemmataceae bacterium]|nr:FeoB-associated Cys-rich membrane protein [Gemmataceae bacterium]